MKIYLSQHIKEIELFNYVDIMLRQFLETCSDYPTIDMLPDGIGADPVRDYIEYHLKEYNRPLDDGLIEYISNSLYKSKGSPKVLEVLSEVLGLNIHYDYEFPNELELDFDSLAISNLDLYVQKLTLAFYHLLFFDKLIVHIKELQLLWSINLKQVITSSTIEFINHGLIGYGGPFEF